MRIRLIRHATLLVEFGQRLFLVDPMLAEVGSYPSLTFGATARRNPTVAIPCDLDELLSPDAILLTHTHFDHFDAEAVRLIPKDRPVVGQPSDRAKVLARGFEEFHGVDGTSTSWNGIEVARVEGRHGHGLLRFAMGASSGFALRAAGEPTLYVVGDSIWCPEVRRAIMTHRPEVIVVNSGACRFNVGAPIVMDVKDVVQVCEAAPDSIVVVVHMEAVNHCRLTRAALLEGLTEAGVAGQVRVPGDGDVAV